MQKYWPEHFVALSLWIENTNRRNWFRYFPKSIFLQNYLLLHSIGVSLESFFFTKVLVTGVTDFNRSVANECLARLSLILISKNLSLANDPISSWRTAEAIAVRASAVITVLFLLEIHSEFSAKLLAGFF